MVYYRKYRPQTLEEIVGQEQVKLNLSKAFSSNRLSHAYLFCGPRGTGKTSTARILAKMVNCESANAGPASSVSRRASSLLSVAAATRQDLSSLSPAIPCNSCPTCLSITDGSNLDLIEIDAASNRGIDDIRELREKIKLAPSSAKKKVYIIDEVHMLSNEAFNALLKTLEEPPAHVMFILATTEPHKIPETILSRVQRLDFKLASPQDVIKALNRVVDGEKLKVEEGVLELIAKKSDGSFRDGVKLLDQVASTNQKITAELINEVLKSSSFENQVNLIEVIFKKDPASSIKLVLEQVESGVNIKDYLGGCLDFLRAILFIKNNVGSAVKEDLGSTKYQKLLTLSESISLEDILNILNNFQNAAEKIKFSIIPSLPLEIAVIESAKGKTDLPAGRQEVVSREPSIEIRTNEKALGTRQQVTENVIHDSGDLSSLKDKWNYILTTIQPYNYSLEAMLKLARILECNEKEVILEVPYTFHQRIIESPKSKDLLESVLAEVLGRQIKVSTVLGKKPLDREELANVEVAADDEIIRIAAEIFNSEQVN